MRRRPGEDLPMAPRLPNPLEHIPIGHSDPARFTPHTTAIVTIVVGVATIGAASGAWVYDAQHSTPFVSALFLFGGGLILHVIGVKKQAETQVRVDAVQQQISAQVADVRADVKATAETAKVAADAAVEIQKKVNGELEGKVEGAVQKSGEQFSVPRTPEEMDRLIDRVAECVCAKLDNRLAEAVERAVEDAKGRAERMSAAPERQFPGGPGSVVT
jgi:hypothetical protein